MEGPVAGISGEFGTCRPGRRPASEFAPRASTLSRACSKTCGQWHGRTLPALLNGQGRAWPELWRRTRRRRPSHLRLCPCGCSAAAFFRNSSSRSRSLRRCTPAWGKGGLSPRQEQQGPRGGSHPSCEEGFGDGGSWRHGIARTRRRPGGSLANIHRGRVFVHVNTLG